MKNTEVNVIWNQQGTWGTVGFAGKIYYHKTELSELFDGSEQELVLEVTEGPEQYLGLILRPGESIPGLFANGYDHPFTGKCYSGDIKIGESAANLKQYNLPSVIFAGNLSYLHIEAEQVLTKDQRDLLLEAVRFDSNRRFPAGASITKLFTQDELEGTKKGQIFYT